MNTDFDLYGAISFIHAQTPNVYFPEKIQYERLEKAVRIIHNTFTDVPIDEINQLKSDLTILQPYAEENTSLQGIITKYLKLASDYETKLNLAAIQTLVNHPGYFGNTVRKAKEFVEQGIIEGKIPKKHDPKRKLARMYTDFCFGQAIKKKRNIIMRGGRRKTHELYLLRDSGTVKNTENIRYFVLTFTDTDKENNRIKSKDKLCGYDSETRKWSTYQNVKEKKDKNGNIINASATLGYSTEDSLDSLIKDYLDANIVCMKPGDYKVGDFLIHRYGYYL